MSEPIIVDKSIWISFFHGVESPQSKKLTKYIELDYPIYVCPTIIQEVLQGVRNDKQYRVIKENLLAFNILNDDGVKMAISAANLYRKLRKKGLTIRKSNDCLIAQYAIDHSLTILHQDRDFDLIMNNHTK